MATFSTVALSDPLDHKYVNPPLETEGVVELVEQLGVKSAIWVPNTVFDEGDVVPA